MRAILFFISLALTTLFFSCSSNDQNISNGPLISELDKKEDLIIEKDTTTIKVNKNLPQQRDLITNSNVLEKLTAYGLENKETKIRIKTKYGSIKIRLFEDTPLHRANFIMLIKKNYFDSTLFYRVINNFVVQGGNSDRDNVAIKMANIGHYKIPDEIKSNHIHKRGALAMAVHEQEGVPDNEKDKRSSPYNFYIVQHKPLSEKYMDKLEARYKFTIPEKRRRIYHKYGGLPHLDDNYTVFGEVYSGMSVVDKIAFLSTDGYDRPIDDLFLTIEIIK